MRELTGLKWMELTADEKQMVLIFALPTNGIDCTTVEDGECIVDVSGADYSVAGRVVEGVVVIEDEALFYNPML